MKVILLQNVPKIGKKDDIKEVSAGYAHNFLFPQKLAEIATEDKIKKLKEKKQYAVIQKEIQGDLLVRNLKELSEKEISFSVKANEHGHLFSGINEKQLVEALFTQHHITIDPKAITLPEPIRVVGDHTVYVKMNGVAGTFKVLISKEA